MSIPKIREQNEPAEREKSKLKGDWCNILLLTYMYILQCIPRGLAEAVPLVLQKRKITYTDQVSMRVVKKTGSAMFKCVYSYSFRPVHSGGIQFVAVPLRLETTVVTYRGLGILEYDGKTQVVGHTDATLDG